MRLVDVLIFLLLLSNCYILTAQDDLTITPSTLVFIKSIENTVAGQNITISGRNFPSNATSTVTIEGINPGFNLSKREISFQGPAFTEVIRIDYTGSRRAVVNRGVFTVKNYTRNLEKTITLTGITLRNSVVPTTSFAGTDMPVSSLVNLNEMVKTNSPGLPSFTSADTTIATIRGNKLAALSPGVVTVTGFIPPSAQFKAAINQAVFTVYPNTAIAEKYSAVITVGGFITYEDLYGIYRSKRNNFNTLSPQFVHLTDSLIRGLKPGYVRIISEVADKSSVPVYDTAVVLVSLGHLPAHTITGKSILSDESIPLTDLFKTNSNGLTTFNTSDNAIAEIQDGNIRGRFNGVATITGNTLATPEFAPATAMVVVTVIGTGSNIFNENINSLIRIYPNPSDGIVYFSIPDNATMEIENTVGENMSRILRENAGVAYPGVKAYRFSRRGLYIVRIRYNEHLIVRELNIY